MTSAGFQLPGVGQAVAAPTISRVTVGTVGPQAQTKTLTREAIERHIASAQKAGPLEYWQVAKPTRRLKLTNAVNYVNQHPEYANAPADNHFVYWEQYRVVGTVNDIANAFRQAGVPIDANTVRAQALDPLNPQHRAAIEAATASAPAAEKPKAKHSLEEYVKIGKAIKESGKQPSGVTAVRGTVGARGGRSPEANLARLQAEFTQMMGEVLSGREPARVFDVSKFDVTKRSGARKAPAPKSPRATAIRPVINVNGRPVAVPIIAQPAGAENFRNFVMTVVPGTPYAQYADEILVGFSARPAYVEPLAPTISVLPATATFPTVVQPSMTAMQQLAGSPRSVSPPGSPRVGGTPTALPMVGGLPTVGGGLPMVSGLPTVGRPATTGFQLPTVGSRQ